MLPQLTIIYVLNAICTIVSECNTCYTRVGIYFSNPIFSEVTGWLEIDDGRKYLHQANITNQGLVYWFVNCLQVRE